MWRFFFEGLGYEVTVSPKTNRKIFEIGCDVSVDEACASAKIYMGHVNWLIGKCDYIFVPRYASYEGDAVTCTKFLALYDTVKTVFPAVQILDMNVDYSEGVSEWKGYKKLGHTLGASTRVVRSVYQEAKKSLYDYRKELEEKQNNILNDSGLKILIVAHPYNIYDELIGYPVVKTLKDLKVNVIYADVWNEKSSVPEGFKGISCTLYWRYNQELLGAVEYYRTRVDGIIFLSTFPCGPDSLVTELVSRKLKGIPITNLIVDGNSGEAGLQTRIESFIDVVEAKKKRAIS